MSEDYRKWRLAELEAAHLKIGQLTNEMAEAEKRWASQMLTQINLAQGERDAARAEIDQLRAENAILNQRVGVAKRSLEEARGLEKALCNEIATAQAFYDSDHASLERALARANSVIDELGKRLAERDNMRAEPATAKNTEAPRLTLDQAVARGDSAELGKWVSEYVNALLYERQHHKITMDALTRVTAELYELSGGDVAHARCQRLTRERDAARAELEIMRTEHAAALHAWAGAEARLCERVRRLVADAQRDRVLGQVFELRIEIGHGNDRKDGARTMWAQFTTVTTESGTCGGLPVEFREDDK